MCCVLSEGQRERDISRAIMVEVGGKGARESGGKEGETSPEIYSAVRAGVCLGIAAAGVAGALWAYSHRATTTTNTTADADGSDDGTSRGAIDGVVTEKDEADFDKACDFVASSSLVSADVFDGRELLELYGLYKQATCGECPKSRGGEILSRFLSVLPGRARALGGREEVKRLAWRTCAGMTRSAAMTMYVGKVLAKTVQKDIDFRLDDEDDEEGGRSEDGPRGWVINSVLRDAYEDPDGDPSGSAEGGAAEANSAWYNAVASGGEGGADVMGLLARDPAEARSEAGFDLTERDAKGRTLLHWAVDHGNASLVEALLGFADRSSEEESGGGGLALALIDAQDCDGQTPLHYAALCEYFEIYRSLVRRGGDEAREDASGETPAFWKPASWAEVAEGAGEGAEGEGIKHFIGWQSN